MPKTPNLNLELTSDEETLFTNWWKAINGVGTEGSRSNMQIIDEAFGNIQASVNVTARAGEHIGDVGTPSVTVSQETDPQTGDPVTVLTFNYLKGATGANGQNGQDGQDGKDGLTTKIEVNNVEYTQVDGKITLPDYPSAGTTVIANPVLEGTEPNLTGIQVGANKFKVPSGGGSSSYPYQMSQVQVLNVLQGKVFNYSKAMQLMENIGLDFSYAAGEETRLIADTIFKMGLRTYYDTSSAGDYIFFNPLVSLQVWTSGSYAYYTLNLTVNEDDPESARSEETAGPVAPSSLEFSGFDPISPFYVDPSGEDETLARYYIPTILPLVSCVQYDEEEGYMWVIKQFEWEDFFACFDTPNE